MGTIQEIAFRNLNRQKKRSFLLGGAIAFGIVVVTCITSLSLVLQTNLSGNMAQLSAGHLFVQGVEKLPSGKNIEIIRDDTRLLEALEDSGIAYDALARRSIATGQLIFNGRRTNQNIFGISLEREAILHERLKFKEGSLDRLAEPGALILSEGIVKRLKLELDDRLDFSLRTITGQNNVGSFVLVGIIYDMGLLSEAIAYCDQSYLNSLRDMAEDEYEWFGVLLSKLSAVDASAAKLTEALKKRAPVFELSPLDLLPPAVAGDPATAGAATASGEGAGSSASSAMMGASSRYAKIAKLARTENWEGVKYRIFTINDTLSTFLDIAKTLSALSIAILLTLFLIIMVGIANTFRMIMFERIKEIGTMRALGMQKREVRQLFLWEALFLGLGGVLAGWVLSAIILFTLSLFSFGTDHMISLFLLNGRINFMLNIPMMIIHLILVLTLTVLAAALPARKAARLSPAVALRTAK